MLHIPLRWTNIATLFIVLVAGIIQLCIMFLPLKKPLCGHISTINACCNFTNNHKVVEAYWKCYWTTNSWYLFSKLLPIHESNTIVYLRCNISSTRQFHFTKAMLVSIKDLTQYIRCRHSSPHFRLPRCMFIYAKYNQFKPDFKYQLFIFTMMK